MAIVEKAFKELPTDHIILKYLVRFFGSVWRTDSHVFIETYEPRGPHFERFLYGVCWRRAYPTRKLADQLMWRWCESHDHTSEAEQKKCHVWRDSLVNKHWGDKEWEKDMDERSSLNRALKHLDINSLSQVPAVHNEPIQAEQRPSLIVKLAISFPIVSTLDTDDELYRDLTPLPPNLMDASRQRRISTSSFESDLDGSESISVSSSEVLEGSSSSESE